MKKTVLFGAGQVGIAVSRLLGADYVAVCFADNNEKRWGSSLAGLPVLSLRASLELMPDCVCLCVVDDERANQMRAQLAEYGFRGELITPSSLRIFDMRTAAMRMLSEQIRDAEIPGDIAELGVFRGEFAAKLNAAFPDRSIHLFDTFEGFSAKDIPAESRLSHAKAGDFSETSEELVYASLPYPERAIFHKGWFPDTFQGCEACRFAFVSIDADLYAPTAAALPIFWERLSPGGVLMIHDVYSMQYEGVSKAVTEFCRERAILPTPVCDLHGSAVIRKELTRA